MGEVLEEVSVFDVASDLALQAAEREHEDLEKAGNESSWNLTELPYCRLPDGERYLMVRHAYEQFMGARQVIGDAVDLAMRLNRTMVEPVMHNSRVVDPFETNTWIPLSQLLDIDAMKGYWDRWISIDDFLALCRPGQEQPPRVVVHKHAQKPTSETLELFRDEYQSEAVIAMDGFRRKGNGWTRSADGVPLDPSPWIRSTGDAIAEELEGSAGGFICAQWRSERVAKTKEQLQDCVGAFAETVAEATRCHLWNSSSGSAPNVLLLSDVREDETSDTLRGSEKKWHKKFGRSLEKTLRSKRSSALLEEMLRSRASHASSVASESNASKMTIEDIDRGLQAAVEQYVCTRARVMVGCDYHREGRSCGHCTRLQSKFAGWIHAVRQEQRMLPAIGW